MNVKNSKPVLIIEDDQALRTALQAKFESQGYQVLTAENGETGLQMILDTKPGVVLLDIMMPQIDGLSMLDLKR